MSQSFLSDRMSLGVTSVPTAFITDYMPFADETCTKVYLYLLHGLSRESFSLKTIEEALQLSRERLCIALQYWQEKGLLRLEMVDSIKGGKVSKRLTGIILLPVVSASSPIYLIDEEEADEPQSQKHHTEPPATSAQPVSVDKSVSMSAPASDMSSATASVSAPFTAKPAPSADPLSRAAASVIPPMEDATLLSFQEDPGFKCMLYTLSTQLGRTLTPREADKLAQVYKLLRQQEELVYLVTDYCSKNRKSASAKLRADDILRVAEDVAQHYAHEESLSPKEVKTFLYDKYATRFLKEVHFTEEDRIFSKEVLLHLSPSVTTATQGNLNTIHYWRTQFSDEVFLYACDMTRKKFVASAERGEELDLWGYLSGTLKGWQRDGIKTVSDAQEKLQAYYLQKQTAQNKSGAAKRQGLPERSARIPKKDYNDFPQHDYDYSKVADDVFNKIFEEEAGA